MKTYNKFVDYYDEIIRWNWYDIDSEVKFIDEIIMEYSSKKAESKILEFACGTWTIAKYLENKWYDIFWVDLSEQMIEKANDKNKFIIWDMTSIKLGKKYDVILCNYNSVCHLNSWKDWQDFFKNSYEHLNKWWILIFDILTIFEFENIASEFRGFFNVWDDTICLEMFKHWEYYKWLIKMFVSSGENNFELIKEEIKEISFPIIRIKEELEKTWFEIKHLEDFHFWEVNTESERVYFIAKK
jgi:SAM-dependent methyltransferase